MKSNKEGKSAVSLLMQAFSERGRPGLVPVRDQDADAGARHPGAGARAERAGGRQVPHRREEGQRHPQTARSHRVRTEHLDDPALALDESGRLTWQDVRRSGQTSTATDDGRHPQFSHVRTPLYYQGGVFILIFFKRERGREPEG